jgi:hypothetical protein
LISPLFAFARRDLGRTILLPGSIYLNVTSSVYHNKPQQRKKYSEERKKNRGLLASISLDEPAWNQYLAGSPSRKIPQPGAGVHRNDRRGRTRGTRE